jgi:predicted site-specific integrase-resolvase
MVNLLHSKSEEGKFMRLCDAARKLGISATSLRRLDRRGVIKLERDLNGHRRVTDGEIDMLRRIIYPETPRRQLADASGSGS